jgi:PAS domain S-box-containing protein
MANLAGRDWSLKALQFLRLQGVSGLLVLCLLGIIILASNVWRELTALERISADNSQWSLMQTEVEILRLQLAVVSANANAETASLEEVRQWFDIVYARANMLAQSETYAPRLLSPKLAPDAKILRSFLDKTVPLIDGPDSELRVSLHVLADMLPEIRQAARRLTLTARTEAAKSTDTRRNAVTTTLLELALLTAIMVMALTGLSLMLLRQMRSSRMQLKANNLTSARLQTIFATSADAIIVTNRGGWIVDINPAAEVVFGHMRSKVLGIHALDLLLPPELAIAQSKEIEAILESSSTRAKGKEAGPLRIELMALRSDGARFPVELSLGSMLIASGGVIVALVRDISERRHAQTALTNALEQAQAGERAKADFIAVMSHEMRTPLNGLLGSLDLLAATNLQDGQKDLINVMSASGQILLHHVNSVLDISKAEADRAPVARVSFDLDQLIEGSAANQAGLAAAKGLNIIVNVPNGPMGYVVGDPARLRQILLNFIGNAVKFTLHGNITVEVERDGSGPFVEIRVIDKGIGIEEADLERIFDDFVTLDTHYWRQTSGTGLGLGISRRMAHAMGGEIGVESILGEGSLFWVRLSLPAEVEMQPAASSVQQSDFSKPPLKVLIIEDNPVNRFVLRRLLEENDNLVVEAADGSAGVAAAKTQSFDLIMTDISMPNMDGLEVARLIRKDSGPSQHARIVAVTAHALPEDLARFRAAGMDDCLTKPITRVSLGNSVAGIAAWDLGKPNDQILDPSQLAELSEKIGKAQIAALISRVIVEGDAAEAEGFWLTNADGNRLLHAFAGTAGTFGARSMQAQLAALSHARAVCDAEETLRLTERLSTNWHRTRTALLSEMR